MLHFVVISTGLSGELIMNEDIFDFNIILYQIWIYLHAHKSNWNS